MWAEALTYTCHLANKFSSVAIGGKTPMEVWPQRVTIDYGLLRIFWCLAYCRVKDARVDPSTKKFVFIEFKWVFGYKLWYPKNNMIVLSMQVKFNNLDNELFMLSACRKQPNRDDIVTSGDWCTPWTPGNIVSCGLLVDVIQQGNQVARVDTVECMSQEPKLHIQIFLAAKKPKLDMIGSQYRTVCYRISELTRVF